MPNVTIYNGTTESTITVECGDTLLSAIHRTNAGFIAPCGGLHRCGKCEVKVSGAVSSISEAESAFPVAPGNRLACFTRVEGDCTVQISADHKYDVLLNETNDPKDKPSLSGEFGIAVDIGTTTIAASLYDLNTGALISTCGDYNRQAQFGADVLSRIYYTMETDFDAPWSFIVSQLDSLFLSLCRNNDIEPSSIKKAVITGNTVMLHFMAHLDARGIASAPFTPASLFGNTDKSALPHFENTEIYYPPCVSAYIGADITCGLLSTNLANMPGNILFMDIGTNGEIILKTSEKMYSCSAAAGPAFEGAGISCGSGAVSGAISHISWTESDGYSYTVIDNEKPVSLCGSGLIDAISVLLDSGVINIKGNFRREFGKQFTFPGTQVTLTQEDIRSLQLAKASIRAGADVLLHEAGIESTSLDALVLAGGFGVKMNPVSAVRIGLLPDIGAKPVMSVGNSSAAGAALILTDSQKTAEIERLISKIQHIELSLCDEFYPNFVKSMSFG